MGTLPATFAHTLGRCLGYNSFMDFPPILVVYGLLIHGLPHITPCSTKNSQCKVGWQQRPICREKFRGLL